MNSIARATALAVALAAPLFALPAGAGASHSLFEHVSDADPRLAGSGAVDAAFHGSSADGKRVFFSTNERLAPGDQDTATDVYERSGGQTRLVSNGTGAFNASFGGASADGSRVFFHTTERLVAADTDAVLDLYERSGGTTSLVSAGIINGNGAFVAVLDGASADGSRVFFHTSERLVAADTDNAQDVYERSGGTTSLVSAGAIDGNDDSSAIFRGASADGTRVFFETDEQLVAADIDNAQDVYERSGAATNLISVGGINGNGAFDASFAGSSTTGTRVFFESSEQLAATDTDGSTDTYERSNGVTRRVSAGAINGNGVFGATFRGASANGARVFFVTGERLAGADTDASIDVYERSGGTTKLVSIGNGAFDVAFQGASADGTRVFYETRERLVFADDDQGARDVYMGSGTSTTLVSASSNDGAFDASFRGASADGSRAFFSTNEGVSIRDTDGRRDLYERSLASAFVNGLTQISPGNGAFDADFAGASSNGAAVFFTTREKEILSDEDSAIDIYGAFALP
jgi:hypothetical protein